jgi:dTDP-4-dehydrorhamnose reductase
MKLLVLGASGMLGASLVPALGAREHMVTPHGRRGPGLKTADLGDAAQARELLLEVRPEAAINLVGLTDVDLCESQPQLAWLANVRTAENIAAACKEVDCHFVHISTDQVYDGEPPRTEDQACPGNYYGITKYAGELAALSVGATVLRTNFFGASRHATRRSLTDWLHAALTEGRPIQVFEDVRFSPLSMATLCGMVERLVHLRPAGLFNLGSREGLSKADFAFAFARAMGLSQRCMTRASVQQTALKAWRPKDMRMDSTKIERILAQAMPRLEDEIELAAKDYRADV